MENSKSNTSNTGYKGITFVKEIGKFQIYIAYRRNFTYGTTSKRSIMRKHHLGYYDTLKEAIKQREKFINNLY